MNHPYPVYDDIASMCFCLSVCTGVEEWGTTHSNLENVKCKMERF